VEITVFSFSERAAPAANCSQEEFRDYERQCARDAGLDHLRPVSESRPGNWFYELAQLADPHSLEALAKHALDTTLEDGEEFPGVEDLEEAFSAFDGGLVVFVEGELFSVPGCCCDLGEIDPWREAVEQQTTEWVEPWTGHDYDAIRIRYNPSSSLIELEFSEWLKQDWGRGLSLSAEDALAQLVATRKEQEHLATRLAECMPSIVPHVSREPLARLFAGLRR
ncbi:MAG: hypothetical protein KC492_12380, partial [Myxococcales bacterium]|nr:hypothetical protein [Myxococcales bacterium]